MSDSGLNSEKLRVDFQKLYDDSVHLLHGLTTPDGILASTVEADNYKRIWARDSIICGLAGLMIKDTVLIEGLKNSLLTLAKTQHELGMIPSNVLPTNHSDVSFGSLAGRVDAHTWFIVGCCNYYLETQDTESWMQLKPAVEKCRTLLKISEFNDKGWIYTPLSGNWADEYPVHGYTLYDNMLRLWGESLWGKITGETFSHFDQIKNRTNINFWPTSAASEEDIYHNDVFKQLDVSRIEHFMAFLLPGVYDQRFDAAGNALALLQYELSKGQKQQLSNYISKLSSELTKPLIPAFWPIITPESADWNLLKGNFSFNFKNHPGAFHNGGVWPVWMGLFCLGLSQNGMYSEVKKIIESFTQTVLENNDWDFQEYFDAQSLKVGGKTQMGYTASGIVFMHMALKSNSVF
ncbi:MAG: glycoside hydrolase 100 family protein [Bacteroidota bacterium]